MKTFFPLAAAFSAGVALSLVPSVALAAPSIALQRPAANEPYEAAVSISAVVTSPVVLKSVTARVGALQVPLTRVGALLAHSGTLDISSLPVGAHTIEIVAEDLAGDVTTASVQVIRDNAPRIVVETLDGTRVSGMLPLKARCVDTDTYGCASFTAKYAEITQTGTPAGIDRTVPVSPYGKILSVTYEATDRAGLTSSKVVRYWIDDNVGVVPALDVGGIIVDVDRTRVLFTSEGKFFVRTIATGVDVMVGTVPSSGLDPARAKLVPRGVVWAGGEWLDGVAATNAISPTMSPAFQVAGAFVAYLEPQSGRLMLRDLSVAGSVPRKVADNVVPFALAANGDVVYAGWPGTGALNNWEVRRDRAGATTTIAAGGRWAGLSTDGVNVAFQRYPTAPQRAQLWNGTATEDFDLFAAPPSPTLSPGNYDYATRNGWLAYTTWDGGREGALYTRSPAGDKRLVSLSSQVREILALSDDGDVAFADGELIRLGHAGTGPANPVAPISLARLGTPYSINGVWYLAAGRHLLRATTQPTPAPPGGGIVRAAISGIGAGGPRAMPTQPQAVSPPGDKSPGPDGAADQAGDAGGCQSSPSSSGAPMAFGFLLFLSALRNRRRAARAQE